MNGPAGDDVINAAAVAASAIALTLDGGNDDDVLNGAAGTTPCSAVMETTC